MVRNPAVDDAIDNGGALGISRIALADEGTGRGTAINAPPADIFITDPN
jgi:hypothetical protein